MALESAARVMNGTFGQIWEDGTEIAEVSAFQLKVTNNFDNINLCRQMAEDRKLISVKITGSMTLHKVFTRGADAVTAALAGRDLRKTLVGKASWRTRTPMVPSGWPPTASAMMSRR